MIVYAIPTLVANAPSTSAVNYINWDGTFPPWRTTQDLGSCIGGDSLGVTYYDWTVTGAAPGASGSYLLEQGYTDGTTFTASGLQVSIPAGSTSPWNSGGLISNLAQGRRAVVRCTPTGTPNSLGIMSWNCYRVSTNQMISSSASGATFINANTTRYLAPMLGGANTGEPNEVKPVPFDCTIGNIYVILESAPGAGNDFTIDLMKLAPSSGYSGSGTSQKQIIISGSATTGTYSGARLSYTQGDLIYFKLFNPLGAPTNRVFLGYDCVGPYPGAVMILAESFPSTAGTTYNWLGNIGNATEANAQVYMYPCTLRNHIACVSGAASTFTDLVSGHTCQVDVRQNGSSSGCPTWTCTGAGGAKAQQKSDLTTVKVYTRGQLANYLQTISNNDLLGVHEAIQLDYDQGALFGGNLFQPRGVLTGVFEGW